MSKRITGLAIFVFLASIMTAFNVRADDLHDKLDQCKKEFAISHNKNVSQEKAMAAKIRHLKLMKDILVELNKRNVSKNLSSEALQENVMVMSHLMEMMVKENLANKMYDLEVHY